MAAAVFLSDFLGDLAGVEAALARPPTGAWGVLMQVLDPAEEEFPFDGRTIFESMGGTLRHETQQAGDLRGALSGAAGRTQGPAGRAGARCRAGIITRHHTGQPAQSALLWAYRALEGGRDDRWPLALPRRCCCWALVALPILWLLLRAVPPAPIRRRFPGVALLLGLTDEDRRPTRRRGGCCCCGCWRWRRRSSALPGRS